MPNRRNETGFCAAIQSRLNKKVVVGLVIGLIVVVVIISVVTVHVTDSPSPSYLEIHPNPGDKDVPFIYVDFENTRKDWKTDLTNFMEPYYKFGGKKKLLDCVDGDRPQTSDGSCFFDVLTLGDRCQEGSSFYGFEMQQPCFFVTPKKIKDWEPEVYVNMSEVPEKMPEGLKEFMKTEEKNGELPPKLWIWCEGTSPVDKEYLGPIVYFPSPGFDYYYFPYNGADSYMSPIVALQFKRLHFGIALSVRCTSWAKNIDEEHVPLIFEFMLE